MKKGPGGRRPAGAVAAVRFFDVLIDRERDRLDILARRYGPLGGMCREEARFWPF